MLKKYVKQALGYKVGAPRTPSAGVAERVTVHCIYTCFSVFLSTLHFGEGHVTTVVNRAMSPWAEALKREFQVLCDLSFCCQSDQQVFQMEECFSTWVPECLSRVTIPSAHLYWSHGMREK